MPPSGLVFTAEQETVVEVRATDFDGNPSDIAVTTIRIDRTPPVVSYTVAEDGSSVTFTVVDDRSGVDGFWVNSGPVDPNEAGQFEVSTSIVDSLDYRATDIAGRLARRITRRGGSSSHDHS